MRGVRIEKEGEMSERLRRRLDRTQGFTGGKGYIREQGVVEGSGLGSWVCNGLGARTNGFGESWWVHVGPASCSLVPLPAVLCLFFFV